MWFESFQDFYALYPQEVLFGGLAVAAFLTGLMIWLRWRRKTADERRVLKAVKAMSRTYLRDLIIPDGLDGFLAIDYLLLTPGGVLVLDVQNYGGVLFGGERIDQWTQMVGHRSYKFDNPLRQNISRVQAVKALIPDVPVKGRVVFGNNGSFPKGVPAGVSMLGGLKEDLASLFSDEQIPESWLAAWEQVVAQAQQPYKV